MSEKTDHFEISAANCWICPVCGKRRNIGNHAKCSKITQIKHQREREAQSLKRVK